MWPNIADQAMTRPLLKMGISISQSLTWLMAPSTEYGSLVRKMSPSSTVPSYPCMNP